MQMTNVQIPMTKEFPNSQSPKVKLFNLCERTEKFGERILEFAQGLPVTVITRPLIEQLVRSGTSVGANHCEADDASSKKDFVYKVGICQRETKETKYWLKMIIKTLPNVDAIGLINEAQELKLIFSAIIDKARNK